MGVYIRGMEMPANCFLCKLSYLSGERLFCSAMKNEEVLRSKIDSNCPLIELPPHGDLIERKAAYESILDGMVMTGYQSRALDCISECYVPTIIEAEEEGET